MFHRKGNMAAILGDKSFKEWVYEELLPELGAERKSRVVQPDLTMQQVTDGVAAYYKTNTKDLLKISRGPQTENKRFRRSVERLINKTFNPPTNK
jgi:hypothetical protein